MRLVHSQAAPPVALLTLAMLAASVASAAERTWTNDQGQTLEAELINVRGDTAFLRSGGKRIPAPLERLSEADRQWIARYQELTGERAWGVAAEAITAEFRSVEADGVKLRTSSETLVLPFAKLTQDDWRRLAERYKHLGETPPENFAAERAAAKPIEPPADAVERQWTDARGRAITAAYEGVEGKSAVLWVKSKRFEYPLERLSEADRKWIARRNVQQLMDDLRGGASVLGSLAMAGPAGAAGPGFPGQVAPGQVAPGQAAQQPPGYQGAPEYQGEFGGGYPEGEYGQPGPDSETGYGSQGVPPEALQGRPLIGRPPRGGQRGQGR
ncbi:hypothetical protein [Botrimarina sp.]|uniref:hypothetical protein n=1 Tax=Botrimarina sp. TaxID=2795802 RepID=UPI0032EF17BA